ncbi:MAG: hypothetical protein ACTSYM_07345 [Candidatus Baldrarchaeia archaeon]
MIVKEENGKIIGFLRLHNDFKVDISFDKSSKTVLIGFNDYISKMDFKEFKDLVKALKTYVKYIEDGREKLTI